MHKALGLSPEPHKKDKAQKVWLLSPLFHCPTCKRPQEHSQIVSFSSLANVLLRSFPMRLQTNIGKNTVEKGRRGTISTLAPKQPIPTFIPKTSLFS
jgi:hypothetical protein